MRDVISVPNKETIRDIVRFALCLQSTKALAKKMQDDNEHLEYFIEHGIDVSSFYKLDCIIREFERGL